MIIRRIAPLREQRKLRVAAYARVSTETEEQAESFQTQVDYYTRLIRQNVNWEFVEVYADRGKTATSADHRPAFQRMMADAAADRFDILLVKAISRFARNVVDAQQSVHALTRYGVEVRFENEAISSTDPSTEMMFNILAATAQEEARNKSEHVKWSYRRLAEQGIRHIGNNRVLGYNEVEGTLSPNGDAWIVRFIFERYADGDSIARIATQLNEAGAKRLRSDQPFSAAIIRPLLQNELYKGDRLLQKAAPRHYLTKKPDATLPYTSHYRSNDHKAIVDNATWDRVQARLLQTQRERLGGIYRRESAHFLYGLVFCAHCGAPYTRRTVPCKGGTHKLWKCAERMKGKNGNGCRAASVAEGALLRIISDQLGLVWTDAEHLDTAALLAAVQRVEVNDAEIRILTKAKDT